MNLLYRIAASVLFSYLLTACANISETNADPSKNNTATFRKDLKECKEDYPEAGSGVHIRQWQGCMELKGWR